MSAADANAVVLTIADLNPKKHGSFEMFTIALSRALAQRGGRSVLVFSKKVPDHLAHHFEGIAVETLSLDQGLLNFYSGFRRLLRVYRPRVVHLHFYPFFALGLFPVLVAALGRIVFTDHSSVGTGERSGVLRLLVGLKNRAASGCIAKILCVSNFIKERDAGIPGMDRAKLQCIYNGVDLSRFRPGAARPEIRAELGLAPEDFVVVTAVALIKAKGIDFLLQAAARLLPERPDLVFLVAGDGPERSALEAQAAELRLGERVRFLGMRNDVARLLTACDLYLYPSIWQEACALGLIEAMACGLPIVATRVGGTPEIVEDGVNGLVVAPRDSEALVAAVSLLYRERARLAGMGAESLRLCRERFDLDRQVREVLAVYEPYLAQPGRA